MTQANHSSRRDFLKKAAGVVSAASLTAAAVSEAQTTSKNSKLKVGVFGLDYTFWGIWADLMNPAGRSPGTSLFNMEMSHVWDKDIKKAEKFASRWGCTVVKKYDDMLGKVDGVINGGFYNVPWQHKMFRPYIEAGVPTYLSRPWSSRLRDLDEMLDLAAKNVQNGINVIIDASAHKRLYREYARKKIKRFVEVWIKCPLSVCIKRESKRKKGHIVSQMYLRALERKQKGSKFEGLGKVIGVDIPHEENPSAEIIIDSSKDIAQKNALTVRSVHPTS